MSVKNFHDDILAICKYLDEQSNDPLSDWQFRFGVASRVARDGLKGSWRLEDEQGGVHDFEFHTPTELYYKNSIIEDRTPPVLLEPIDESELISIVMALKAKLASGEHYKPFPYDRRRMESPLPGFVWEKKREG